MVGTHHTCCDCFDEGVCPEGCCFASGEYSGDGCPETYNVNITVSECCRSCLDEDAGCDEFCIPEMDLNFTIYESCGWCPEIKTQLWCPTQTEYECEGTVKAPCLPEPTCTAGSCGSQRPDEHRHVQISFRYRPYSYWFPPEEGRIRMEFRIDVTGGHQWLLRMDKPAPNCLDWTLDDEGWNMVSCNNCPVSIQGKEPIPCGLCNEANPSDPNYFGCCYQFPYDNALFCEGCGVEYGGLIGNNWGRTGDMPTYPRTFSTPAILGFTIT